MVSDTKTIVTAIKEDRGKNRDLKRVVVMPNLSRWAGSLSAAKKAVEEALVMRGHDSQRPFFKVLQLAKTNIQHFLGHGLINATNMIFKDCSPKEQPRTVP